MNVFDDELDEVTVQKKTAAESAAAPTPTPKPSGRSEQSKPSSAIAEFGFDNSTETNRALAPSGLPVLKPEQGTYIRFVLVPGAKAKHALVHWSSEHGSIRCISAEGNEEICCQRLGFPKSRFAVPVLRYVNADPSSGKLTAGVPAIEVAVLRMSKTNFRDVRDAIAEDASVYDYDFKITKSENGIAFKITPTSRPPKYQSNAESAAHAAELSASIRGEQVTAKLGKERNRTELGVLLGGSVGEDASLEDLQDDTM